ncbi:unnamed protein product [Blepharisma stoltei]|uniref:RBR-type E3 ubiquitin transferase n=1 Tax=Blepharisma stoltei TaxID=1481888 RepID=A0AAU9IMN2_9CILI|nr:unnamed protein product [Blepharisma stoltei]
MDQPNYVTLEEELEKPKACPICYLEKPLSAIIPSCDHIFCRECLTLYLTQQISESKVQVIKCPSCSVMIQRQFLTEFLDPAWLLKYDRFLLRETLASNPYVRFCPQTNCDGYDLGGSSKKKLKCNQCSFEYCFFCEEKWHGWRKCKKTVDIEFEKWAKSNNVKFCPQCKRRVEKRGGCPNMSCICGATWCWRCGKPNGPHHEVECLIGENIWNIHWVILFALIFSPILLPFAPFIAIVITFDYLQELDSEAWLFTHRKYFYPLLFILSPIIMIIGIFFGTGSILFSAFRIWRYPPILSATLVMFVLPLVVLIDTLLIPVIGILLIIAVISGVILFFIKIYAYLAGKIVSDETYYPKVFI